MQLLRILTTLALSTLHVSALFTPRADPTSYNGIKVLRVLPSSEDATARLLSVMSELKLETWSDAVVPNEDVDVLVPLAQLEAFTRAFPRFETVHEDLGADIRVEKSGFADENSRSALAADLTWFNAYHPYTTHLTWLNELRAQFPTRSKIVTSGTSVQGRTITGIHIFGSTGGGSRPAILFHGNTHAREWISSKVTQYIAYQLLTNYANSTDVAALVDKFDFYIFPVVNPDGFTFSQENTRLWRKNRTPAPSGSTCIGVDLNRNWPFQWSLPDGASTSPCSETYKGTAAESTPEIRALHAYAASLIAGQGVQLYVDWHSYGRLVLYPWGYTSTAHPSQARFRTLGNAFATAVRAVRGTAYTVQQAIQLYVTSGTSRDHFAGGLNVPNSFTIELPTNTFVLPAGEILPVVRETWEGVVALLKVL